MLFRSLGCVSEKRESVNEAVSWYQTALRTCIEGEGISGGTALQKLLRLRAQEVLTAEDRTLCARAAQKSWQVLGLPGEPDLADISRAVSTIKEGEANPPRRRRSPDPLED